MSGGQGGKNIRKIGHETRWKPGQSGNPTGLRPGLSITRLVRDALEKPAHEGSTITNAEMVAAMIVNLAKAGDRAMIPLVWRYVDGEPKQAAETALRELAEKLAPTLGLDPDTLYRGFMADLGAA